MSLVFRFMCKFFDEITFLTQYVGSKVLCYCVYGVLFVASSDFSVI